MIAIKYVIFAVLAIVVNIVFQWLSFRLYTGEGVLYVAIFWGTLAGLVTKYVLDKKWIFYNTSTKYSEDTKKFFLYSLVGVITTIIFWGFEMIFHYLVPLKNAAYYGAILGLSIGYWMKYHLDKRFVFNTKAELLR